MIMGLLVIVLVGLAANYFDLPPCAGSWTT